MRTIISIAPRKGAAMITAITVVIITGHPAMMCAVNAKGNTAAMCPLSTMGAATMKPAVAGLWVMGTMAQALCATLNAGGTAIAVLKRDTMEETQAITGTGTGTGIITIPPIMTAEE
jgi:hypothetical protein